MGCRADRFTTLVAYQICHRMFSLDFPSASRAKQPISAAATASNFKGKSSTVSFRIQEDGWGCRTSKYTIVFLHGFTCRTQPHVFDSLEVVEGDAAELALAGCDWH
jgi:hypothetical protein